MILNFDLLVLTPTMKDLMKVGLRQWPEVYAASALFVISTIGSIGLFWSMEHHNDQAAVRYKHVYMSESFLKVC